MFAKSLFTLILLSLSLAFGAEKGSKWPEPLQKLLELERRPTILELEQALIQSYGKLPPIDTFASDGYGGRLYTESDYIKLLVEAEMLFPGARHFVMGRDANPYGDAMEYFFTRTLNQPGRIKLLDVSNPSFMGYRMGEERTQQVLSAFLKTAGVDVTSTDKPYLDVLTDVTSYSETSQTTRLMVTLFEEARRLGLSPAEALSRFNFLGVNLAYRDPLARDYAEAQELAARQLSLTQNNGVKGFRPLYIKTELMYGATWHEMFRDFVTTKEGTFGVRGQDGSYRDKIGVFREMLYTLYMLNQPNFLEKVQAAALEKGYVYPLARSNKLVAVQVPKKSTPAGGSSSRYSDKLKEDRRIEVFTKRVKEDLKGLSPASLEARIEFWRKDFRDMRKSGSLSADQYLELFGLLQSYKKTESKSKAAASDVNDPFVKAVTQQILQDLEAAPKKNRPWAIAAIRVELEKNTIRASEGTIAAIEQFLSAYEAGTLSAVSCKKASGKK